MDQLLNLFELILVFLKSAWDILVTIFLLLLRWWPLIAWIAFWLFGVSWERLRVVLLKGGCIGLALIGVVTIFIWGSIAPPANGAHEIFALSLSNYAGKTVFVTGLICIMFVCGSLQLSGFCPRCCPITNEGEEAAASPETH